MLSKQVCVCVLAVGAANAFFSLPAVPRASPMRMAAAAGDSAKDPAHHLKQAGKDATGLQNNSSSSSSSSSSSGTAGRTGEVRSSTEKTVKESSGRTGDVRSEGVVADSKETVWEAPVEKTRIHERIEEVDKTRIEEQRVRTEVKQVVQPIKDSRTETESVRREDHGTEVREHGSAGLDSKTEAELKRRRDELARDAGTTKESQTKQTSLRPDVEKKEFVNVVEQVVPVIERDVYVPKKVEHEKKIVEIYNEAPEVKATEIKEAISKEEFEKRYGGKVEGVAAGKDPTAKITRDTTQTTHSSSSASKAGGSVGSSSSSVKHESTSSTQKKSEPAPYSMSSSNMAADSNTDSDAGSQVEGEARGLVGGIKQKLGAVKDKVKDILD